MHLPNNKQLRDVLEGMVGRDVALDTSAKSLGPLDVVGGFVATFVDDNQRLAAILGWSVDAAAYVGCCLGVVPAKMAKGMVTEKYLRNDVIENVSEVSNVIASVLNTPNTPHLRMGKTYYPAPSAPTDLLTYLYQHSARIDVDVKVSGYGIGKIALVSYGS